MPRQADPPDGGAVPRPRDRLLACPAMFRGLFDDASLFPPANLAMAAAVARHLRHQTAWYRETSGPFVCPDAKITGLSAALTASAIGELDLALTVPGGAASLDAAVDMVFADPRLRLRAVEVPIGPAGGAGAVAELAAALDRTPLAGAAAYVEIPVGQLSGESVRDLADHGYRAKLRTGGVTAGAFPPEQALAACLTELAAQRLPFKCTAGLHHAVRHRAADTGFEHHGFLNVLLAVAAALDDATADQTAGVLASTDEHQVAAAVAGLDADRAAAVRELFTSFGTCSTDEPIADLVTLGLVTGN
ncbi:MAG: hypothetical protein ACLQFR_09330 [Streptosporangiaceae bacterium]